MNKRSFFKALGFGAISLPTVFISDKIFDIPITKRFYFTYLDCRITDDNTIKFYCPIGDAPDIVEMSFPKEAYFKEVPYKDITVKINNKKIDSSKIKSIKYDFVLSRTPVHSSGPICKLSDGTDSCNVKLNPPEVNLEILFV